MRTLSKAIVGVVLAASWLLGADVTGKWTAETTGRDGQKRTMTYALKADGDKLTGTVAGGMGGERTIENGKITGDEISFDVKVEFNGEARTMSYKGKIAGDEMKMTVGQGDRMREMTAKRVPVS